MTRPLADRGTPPSGHNRDEDSFDAFMECCGSAPNTDPTPAAPRGRPEPRDDHTGGTHLPVSRQAHLQRDYAALGAKTEHAAATDDRHATASGAADQTPDELPRHRAQGSGTRVETGTNTASKPADQPPGTTRSWGQGHLDYARSEGDARRPSAQAEQGAAQDLDLWIDRITTGEQLALAVSIRWLLTSQSRHLEEEIRTMADVAFGHRAVPHTPPTPLDNPGQWHYVATRLMAHMRNYCPDEMNGLHWQWYRRAALRICTAMQRHNIWAIPRSSGYQSHASGRQQPRSQVVLDPPRRTARHNSPGPHQGPPSGVGSPSGTYRSPLLPFVQQRDRGSPHTPGVQAGAPDKEPWPVPALQPHTASCSTASRLPRGYGQRPWRPQRPAGPTDIICHRSPAPVQEAPHRAGAHPHHSHACRASATGSAPHRPPPGNRRCVQLVCRLPPRVGGRPATGGTARRGHTAKGTRSRPAARTGGGGTNPAKPPSRKQGVAASAPDTGTCHPTNWAHTPRGCPRRGCTTATGTQRRQPGSGRRNDRGLRPSEVQWLTAHRRILSDVPATGALHGKCT